MAEALGIAQAMAESGDPRPGAVELSSLNRHLLAQDAIFVTGGNARAALVGEFSLPE